MSEPPTDSTTSDQRPRRLPTRSLLLLAIVLASSGLGLSTWQSHTHRRRLIADLERAGGVVLTTSRYPDWLRERIDVDRLPRLDRVYSVFAPRDFRDEDVAVLRQFPDLESLSLEGTDVTDGVEPVVAQFPGLVMINVSGTEVTDAGVKRLKRESPRLAVIR